MGHKLLIKNCITKTKKIEEPKKEVIKEVIKHQHVVCDGCREHPIKGDRFKCTQCADYDLCSKCVVNTHKEHVFVKIPTPNDYKNFCHSSVVCDGCERFPIIGIRFKCFECPDYDLCQECEKTEHKHHVMLRIPQPKNLTALLQGKNENIVQLDINNIPEPINITQNGNLLRESQMTWNTQTETKAETKSEEELIPSETLTNTETETKTEPERETESQTQRIFDVLKDLEISSETQSKNDFKHKLKTVTKNLFIQKDFFATVLSKPEKNIPNIISHVKNIVKNIKKKDNENPEEKLSEAQKELLENLIMICEQRYDRKYLVKYLIDNPNVNLEQALDYLL